MSSRCAFNEDALTRHLYQSLRLYQCYTRINTGIPYGVIPDQHTTEVAARLEQRTALRNFGTLHDRRNHLGSFGILHDRRNHLGSFGILHDRRTSTACRICCQGIGRE